MEEVMLWDHPWYSHPDIGRDRSHVRKEYNQLSDIFDRYREEQQEERTEDVPVDFTNGSRFFLVSSDGHWHQKPSSSTSDAEPLYLSAGQLEAIVSSTITSKDSDADSSDPLVLWVGNYDNLDYWAVYLKGIDVVTDDEEEPKTKLLSVLEEVCATDSEQSTIDCKPLREFGDSLEHSHDAGILATANGLVEFHKSHLFCSRCGGSTEASKAGASRTCTQCRRSVYPRIDSAAIMLVTSPCENYALLGRKRAWPSGRYSTLAGFCEVGETLEECCQRETFEESGVAVEPKSVRFVASQPWPFPRSLMIGFRAMAKIPLSDASSLPDVIVDTNEMEDIQWFKKDFVKEHLSLSGSTALNFQPNEKEKQFHIPGKASLARYLITEWANEDCEK